MRNKSRKAFSLLAVMGTQMTGLKKRVRKRRTQLNEPAPSVQVCIQTISEPLLPSRRFPLPTPTKDEGPPLYRVKRPRTLLDKGEGPLDS